MNNDMTDHLVLGSVNSGYCFEIGLIFKSFSAFLEFCANEGIIGRMPIQACGIKLKIIEPLPL